MAQTFTFPLAKDTEIDCKHFYIQDDSPAHQYMVTCPKCQAVGPLLHQGFYLAYPSSDCPEDRIYYCTSCGWDRAIKIKVTLRVTVHVETDAP